MTMVRTCGLALVASLWSAVGLAAPPEVDLSKHRVEITTGFTGSDVLLFGAIDEADDIVVVVRGPLADEAVRRKSRAAGIWINRDSVRFIQVPTYYHVASTRALAELMPPDEQRRLGIGHENLELRVADSLNEAKRQEFRAAFVRLKQRQGLYYDQPGEIQVRGGRLFRTDLDLPSNVPIGDFTVDVYQWRQGMMEQVSTKLSIAKTGLEARVFDFAHRRSSLFGLIAIAIALVAGWIAGVVFRKV